MLNLKKLAVCFFAVAITGNVLPALCKDTEETSLKVRTQTWAESQGFPIGTKGFDLTVDFPEAQWWDQYNDAVLTGYIQQALTSNLDIKMAQSRIEQADRAARIIFARQLPQVYLLGSYARVKGSENILSPEGNSGSENTFFGGGWTNIYILPLIAQYELDVFGANRSKTRSARKTAEASRFDSRTVMLSVASRVAGTYFNLLTVDKSLQVQNNLLKVVQGVLQHRQYLYEHGISSYDDVLVSQQNVSAVQANIAEIQRLQSLLVHQLCILMGEPPISQNNFIRNSLDNLVLKRELPVGTPSTLLTRRPDILSAEALLQRANIDVSTARREFFPTFNLIGLYSYASSDLSRLFDWDSVIASASASVVQSVFTGGRKVANYKLQKAVAKEALQQYHKTVLTAFQEVEDSISQLSSDDTKYRQSSQDVASAVQQVQLSSNRLAEGTESQLDLLLSQQQELLYRQQEVQRKGELLVDNVNLYKSLGGGF